MKKSQKIIYDILDPNIINETLTIPDCKNYSLNNSKTYKQYPINLSDEIIVGVASFVKKKHKWQKIRHVLSLLLSEIVLNIKNIPIDQNWFFNDFGCFKIKIYSKICRIIEPPIIKNNCRRIIFSFEGKLKRKLLREINKNNEKVIKYLNIKKSNRIFLNKQKIKKYEQNRI